MNDDAIVMELDLSRVEDRAVESFDRRFDLPTPEGGTAPCHALATVEVKRSGARYDIRASVKGSIHAACHRCAGEFDMPCESAFELVVSRGQDAVQPENLNEDDWIVIPAGEERYDIFPRVREALILELPIKVLCREDCKGVCPSCGANLNEGECGCARRSGDPRWSALRKLVDRGKDSS
jgi:uncharacterized protein